MVDRSNLHGKSPKKTLRKAHAVKRSRALRTGVAGVAVASTLAMMLPSVVASALQPTQKDIVNASSATRKMGKGRPDSDELNMQRWGAGVLNKSVQTKRLVDLGRKAIEEEALRAASLRELAKSGESADSHNPDSHNAGEVDASGAGKRNELGLRESAAGKSSLLGAGFSGSDLTGLREDEHVSSEGASVEHTSADDTASRGNGSVRSRRSVKDTGAKIVQHPQEEQKPATASNSSSQIKDKIQGSAVQQTQSKSVTSAVNVPANTSVTAPASAKPAAATPAVAPAVKPEVSKPAAENTAVSKPAATNQPEVKPAAKTPAQPQSAQPAGSAQPSQQPQATQPVAKTEPANPQPSQQTQPVAKTEKENAKPAATKPAEEKPDAKPAEEKQSQATQPEAANAGGVKPVEVKPAENKQPAQPANAQPANAQSANTQPVNTESANPASEQNTNAQPASTHAENTNTAGDANAPRGRVRRSVESGDSASDGSSVPSANNAPAAPANNTAAPSASTPSTGTGANAGAGTTVNPSSETPSAQNNAQVQGTQGQSAGSAAQRQSAGNAQGAQGSAQGNTGATGEDKSAMPSAPGSTPAPESRSTSNNQPTPSTPTSGAGTSGAGTTTTNTATDPNSQVIKPNTDNPEAKTQEQANTQVQTDKKPKATYNLKVRYTIGGAANKQLVQPYELTIDVEKLNKLDKDGKYEYIELPKAAGYRPSVYHSGDYQYYVKKGEGDNSKFVIDDGTDADAVRYLRIDKKLITDYAVKERPAVGGNNGAQAPQTSSSQATTNPQSSSSTEPKAEDGIQYYGELNINYAPKTAKYYVRHLVQNLKDKDTFDEAPNIGKPIVVEHKTKDKNGKVTTTKELIHVTEITGTVGSNVTAVSTYIPGYEPEHNLISSPLSDSEDEKDKLVLNLRYYRKAYEVTYDSAGGTDVTAQKVYYGQKVPEVPEPTYRGHHFLGWEIVQPGDNTNLSGDNNNRSSASNRSVTNEAHNYIMPDHDVKFRAVWEANNTTSYRVNVWVQKADLVDKEHPNSLANYDFVGLVERKNVQTDSKVALDKMNDAGVVDDASKLNGASETDYVKNPELGLTKEELQGKDSKHETGLIAKFNWMNDTHVTNLEGYDTTNPGAESNYLKDSSGNYVTGPIDAKTPNWDNRLYKDIFTRYFHVNKNLTKELNSEQHDFVPGRPDLGKRSKSQLCADDLNNTLNLVYDRNTYELIFAKPAGVDNGDNAAIKRKDENGKTTIYCYAGGGGCSDKYVGKDKDEHGTEINHKGYRVNVRYGQKLTDIWPDVNELYFSKEGEGSLGWQLGFAGVVKYRDTPPYRFTKEEFADPRWRAAFKKNPKDKVIPKISDDPEHNPQVTHELKDNQRLLTADKSNQSQPIQVIIRKQSIASAKKGGDISEDDYELSTDSYSKDDTPSADYDYPAPSIAGFNPADGYDTARVGDALDKGDFEANLEVWYNESHAHGDWDDLSEDEQKDFAKKYHLAFRKYRGVPVDEQENYESDDATEFDDNKPLEFKYNRQSPDVQFYNADGNAISNAKDGDAKDSLPFEYSLTKRGKKDLTGEDADLYGNDTSYDASVTKDDANDTSKQFDGKYTFTLNGKTYSIVRPDNLPEDYVFKGWAVDQAGIHLINGKINDNSEGAEGDGKAKGETKDFTMPVNGIKLYAAWGKPEGIKHTVTLNYNMPETDENGKEISGSDVVKKLEFKHYHVIDEKNDIGTPTRKGYDFYGWEIKKNGTILPYAFGNKVVEDITLDAVWVKDTRYNGTFKHIFLKPGVTFADYNNAATEEAKAALVDHISTQTVSGLREHLRYNAEAVYSDETHFPDKQFTSFEASKDEEQNTGEFIYQTYNTRKYKVKYIDQDGKDLLPESEVSSVNRKYDVAFYKPIEGFMPETTQNSFTYKTDEYGKQDVNKIPEITFKYKDVRVLKRKYIAEKPNAEKPNAEKPPYRPDHYTRYVFKVADDQGSMGSVVDWQGSKVADGSALVYDAIKGTKAYQMPLPTVKAKPGYEFDVWTSQIGSSDAGSATLKYAPGVNRLPIRSEEQNSPEVIYTVKFKLKAPVAIDTKVLKPTDALSLDDNSAKELIKNADKYPSNAKFSFATGEKFDSTPGLHKIKVQVKLDGNTAETEVLYRVLPDLVYESDWDKFSQSDYGSKYADKYVPINFTGKNKEGKLIGHDGDNTDTPAGEKTTLTAYVYKGKDVRIRVPQAFGNDYSDQHYHYVFKGWATKVVEPTPSTPSSGTTSSSNPSSGAPKPEEKKQEQTFDINSSDRYENVNLQDGVTYHAIYKRIDYFSSSSDNGTVPEDSVIAIFKPAPGRLWKDKTSGPKVFYVKKGTDLSKIPYTANDSTSALTRLQENLTNAKGTWNRSSMINGKEEVTPIDDVSNWKVDKPFQEFVADQEAWPEPKVQTDYLVAVQDKEDSLPKLTDFITNMSELKAEAALKYDAALKKEVEDIKVEYDFPTEAEKNKFKQKMLKKPALYTVPLKVTIKYKDAEDYKTYNLVGRLKIIYQLMYSDSLPKDDTQPGSGSQQTENSPVIGKSGEIDFVTKKNGNYVKVEFEKPDGTEGSFEGREKYYVWKSDGKESGVKPPNTGVKAPQVTGKKYDQNSFHYEFLGWEMVKGSTVPAARASLPATPLPMLALFATASAPNATSPAEERSVNTDSSPNTKLYTKEQIATMRFTEDTKFRAVFRKVANVLKPDGNEKIPDNYVPYVFLPGFGRRWTDGTYNPKVFYFDPNSENYYGDIRSKADTLEEQLVGFGGWSIYDAAGKKSNAPSSNDNEKKTRVYVANQAHIDDVNASDIVLSVGDGMPGPYGLVRGKDADSNTSIVGMQGAGVNKAGEEIAKPGITTVVVNVTRKNDKGVDDTVPIKVHIRVLPQVIADQDLPEKGTKEYEFIAENYTKVTYVAGNGGTMRSPMHTYWVRNGKESAIKDYIPDVLANAGYVFKDWSSETIEKPVAPADQHKATSKERIALSRMAIMDGMPYMAKLIRNSHNSTLVALQNLLEEARKEHKEQIYNDYVAQREALAKAAEDKGYSDLADEIRNSNDFLQNIREKLRKEHSDVYKAAETERIKALLVKLANDAGKKWIADKISSYKNSSIEALENLAREAGIDLRHADLGNEIDSDALDEQREVLVKLAEDAGKPWIAKQISNSKNSSIEALENLAREAGIDLSNINLNIEINREAFENKREVLAELADEAGNPKLAAKIRGDRESNFAQLKQLLRNAGVNPEISLPKYQSTSETIITANFEKMKKMKFKFSGSVREGVFTNFSLQAISQLLTKGLTSVNGISADCNGTACTISGTPKIVNGKPKVELTFTTTDEYGREAEVTMEIDVIPENKPAPVPEPAPEPQPTPTPEPTPEEDETPDWDFDIDLDDEQTPDQGSCVNPEPCECPLPGANALPEDSVTTPESEAKPEPKLANTGSDTTAAMAAAAWSAALAALGISITKTGKHHRKRRSKES